VKSNLATNLITDSAASNKAKDGEPASSLQVLGELVIRHELADRIRFHCQSLLDEMQLGKAVCGHVASLSGIKSVRVNSWCAALIVEFDPNTLSKEQLIAYLTKLVITYDKSALETPAVIPTPLILQNIYSYVSPIIKFLERLLSPTVQLVISGITLACAILEAPIALTRPLLILSVLPIGLRATDTLLLEGRIGVDALDGIAAGFMIKSGKLKEACFMAALIGLGEYIRERTATHCRKMVDDLLSLAGRSAWLVKGRKRLYVPVEQVKVGDVLVVYPGELIPVDGVAIDGQAAIDQSKLTGESMPIEVTAGDKLYATTILLEGKIYMRCLSIGNDTKAGAILQSLKLAPIYETRIQNYAAAAADKLVLPILLTAAVSFGITRNLMRMISILIFDFSTGIRIAAPTAILSSMYNAGRKGILVKNGACLERLAQVTAIVFDKTGTLTLGEPQVTQVIPISANRKLYSSNEIIALAAAVEKRHHHPAAHAILRYATHNKIEIEERTQSSQVRGMGIKAKIKDFVVVVGSRRLMESEGIDTQAALPLEEQLSSAGDSIAYVAADGRLIGLIAYSDQIRSEAAQAISQLKKLGLQKIVMATGDGEVVAKHIANICGIKEYIARSFPEQKAELVKQLKAEGHTVAVIGDGINDSPALAHADIAFSLHGCTEAAREGADIVLTDGDLRRLSEAIYIARGAMNLVKGNLTLAVIPNTVGLGMATLGMVGPAGATLLNNGSAIACALNSLRPLFSDPWSKADPISSDK